MTGILETFTLHGTKGMSLVVTVREEYDERANCSDVTVSMEAVAETDAGHIYYLDGTVEVAGVCLQVMKADRQDHFVYTQSIGQRWPVYSGETPAQWSLWGIPHNQDGSQSVAVAVRITGFEPQGQGVSGWTVSGSRQIYLTHIPRPSTLLATDTQVGGVSMVAINRCSAGYTHTLAYQFGQLAGYIHPGGVSEEGVVFSDTVVAFTVPESFYTQMPESKTGVCTLTLRTFSGSRQIGQAQSCAMTVQAGAEQCAPTVRGSVEDINPVTLAVTGNKNALVRYLSTAQCTITPQAKNSAYIKWKRINENAVSENRLEIAHVENNRFTFSAGDSRGYEVSMTVQKALVPYVHLTANPVAKRTAPTSGAAVLQVSGNCYKGSFGATVNALQVKYRVGDGAWVQITPAVSGSSYTATAELSGLDYRTAYTVTVQVSDTLESVTKETVIGKGMPVFDWGEEDFTFHVPVRFCAGFYDEAHNTGG